MKRVARLSPYLLMILVASVVLRLALALYLGDSITDIRGGTYDQVSYDNLAQRVVTGHGFSFAEDSWPYARAGQPTAFWSYLYTSYLALVYSLFGHHPLIARLLQVFLVGILTPWLAFRIGKRVFGKRAGLIAAAMTALYLYFAVYAASLMTEAFYITALLWSIDAAMRLLAELESTASADRFSQTHLLRRGLELGLAMGVSILLRQAILFFYLLMCVWLIWLAWRMNRARFMSGALLAGGAVLVILMLPWMVRNYRAFDRLTLPNTNAGFTFFWSNHPIYGTQFEAVLSPSHGVSYQELVPQELRSLNEAALDRALLSEGFSFVLADPGRYLLLSLSRIPVYFIFWPTTSSDFVSNSSRVISFGILLPAMLYGLWISLKRLIAGRERANVPSLQGGSGLRRQYQLLLLLFIAAYTLLHLASWANVRYRLPVDACLILFAAQGVDDLLERFRIYRLSHSALAEETSQGAGHELNAD